MPQLDSSGLTLLSASRAVTRYPENSSVFHLLPRKIKKKKSAKCIHGEAIERGASRNLNLIFYRNTAFKKAVSYGKIDTRCSAARKREHF